MNTERSFTQGVGRWHGGAEVYDAAGEFAGMGTDSRSVVADDGVGRVTVDVSFDGPFSFGGQYTIVDEGKRRRYTGPLNYGLAETLGDGLVDAHNYWHDVGFSQRLFLMVLPGGGTQLSFAILSRGERLAWTVAGEYARVGDGDGDLPEIAAPVDGPPLLDRDGSWEGTLQCLDDALDVTGTTDYAERVDGEAVLIDGSGFATAATYDWVRDGDGGFTPPGPVVGSASLSGGRAISGQFHHNAEGLRCWRREIATRDGTRKGVVHSWFRGGQRVGIAHGVLEFTAR
ncbi:MAG: hypothetical protein ACR2O6_14565 [Ilumatobacteraceae bacterium]